MLEFLNYSQENTLDVFEFTQDSYLKIRFFGGRVAEESKLLFSRKSLTSIIYNGTNYGLFFDCLFRVMKSYLNQIITVGDFELLRFNPSLKKVKDLFSFFFKAENLKGFDRLFGQFAAKYDDTMEYMQFFNDFLNTDFVKKCSDYVGLQEDVATFKRAIQEQSILSITYPRRLAQVKQDYLSLISSKIFLNILNKIYHEQNKTSSRAQELYLQFDLLSFIQIHDLMQKTNEYLELLFVYGTNRSFRKKLTLKDVEQVFHDVDIQQELNIFKNRYDERVENLVNVFSQRNYSRTALRFADNYMPIYEFLGLRELEGTKQLDKYKKFFLKKGEKTNFADLEKNYRKMRNFKPREEDLDIPDLNTNLDLANVNPLFLLIENHVNVIYFFEVLSENIELVSFLMDIYKNFLDSFESKIDILNEEIQAGDYSIKNFHLVDCKHLIRHLKEVAAKNFDSDYQIMMHFLAKNIMEGRVKDTLLDKQEYQKYPNYFALMNSLNKNPLFKKGYNKDS